MSSKVQVETGTVRIGQYKVVTYSYGLGDDVFFLLNGGPGLPCDYLRDPLVAMVDKGYRVVTYDQLGCDKSDRPKDKVALEHIALCRGGRRGAQGDGPRACSSSRALLGRLARY